MSDYNTQAKALFEKCRAIAPEQGPVGTRDVVTLVFDLAEPLGKRFRIDEKGEVQKKSSVATAHAAAMQFYVPDHATMAKILETVGSCTHAAVINATFPAAPVLTEFRIASRNKIGKLLGADADTDEVQMHKGMLLLARVKSQTEASTWQLIDRDVDQFTPDEFAVADYTSWLKSSSTILVGLDKVTRVVVPSSSSRVLLPTGESVGESNGHTWIKVKNADDVERTRVAIIARAIAQKLAWRKPRFSKLTGEKLSGYGSFCTILDSSVWTPGRLVFDGQPVATSPLSVQSVRPEVAPGEQDELDTEASVIDRVETYRASKKMGSPVRIHKDGKEISLVMDNLAMDTPIVTQDGEITTVAQLCATRERDAKVRCQAPFRSSESMAAFFAFDRAGSPFVFDVGTGVKHTMPARAYRGWNKAFESFYYRVRGYISHLLDDSDIAELAIQDQQLMKIVNGMCWEPDRSKFAILNDQDALVRLNEIDLVGFAMHQIHGGGWIDYDALTDHFLRIDAEHNRLGRPKPVPSEAIKFALGSYETNAIIRETKLHRQVISRVVSVDMFAKHASMDLTGDVQQLTLPFAPLKTAHCCSIEQYVSAVEDYKSYWPLFDEWLEVLTAARFAPDRRKAFQWLLAPASWGKGFLMAALQEQRLSFNVSVKEVEAIMEGKPAALSLPDCLHAWVMHTDEWKAASREIKQLNTAIEIAPKNQLRVRVQLYTKVFASAENVRSLIEQGVEQQFAERFSLVQPVPIGAEHIQLDEREVFQRLGKAVYFESIVAYIGATLTQHVEHYRAMGQAKAAVHADQVLTAFHAKYGLAQSFTSLDETVAEVADGLRDTIRQYYRSAEDDFLSVSDNQTSGQSIGKHLSERLDGCTKGYVNCLGVRRKAMVARSLGPLLQAYLDDIGYEASVRLKLSYKTEQIISMVRAPEIARSEKVRVYSTQKVDRGSGTGLKCEMRGDVVWLREGA